MKKQNEPPAITRVALYIRVSGEEQKVKGLSLEAQQERLESFAKEKGWIITGIYIDAAKTARKNMHKRLEFQRMMESVKRNEVDILLFCRLDRWFRSVADYYKVMDVLNAHNCEWKTVDEEYDTTTANGRLYINVKLSIAQNEADICGERIDVVFDSKIEHGTVISGSCPFGYRVNEEKRIEICKDEAVIVQDAFDHYEKTVSQRGTIKYIRETYGVNWCEMTFRRMLQETLYTGIYDRSGRRNEHFCPSIIEKEQFERVQELLKRNARYAPSGKVYIFTSIITCAECGHKMVGCKSRDFYYYRCNQHFKRGRCTHNHSFREDHIEKWLFENLKKEVNKYNMEYEKKAEEKRRISSGREKAALKSKLSKLKELYMNDLIDIEEYKKDYQIYSTALQNIEEPKEEKAPDFKNIERIMEGGFMEIYSGLSREDKRTFWRTTIKEIKVDNDQNIVSISF